jgi:hypothetical protein
LRAALTLVVLAAAAPAQTFTQRGFVETRNFFYLQTAPNDSGLVVAESLVRYEAAWRPRKGVQINLGGDARADSHRQFEREFRLDFLDRELQRPAFSARRYSLLLSKGGLNFEVGRQFIRWGKTDLLNPTDRFAPRDYLNVINTEFLGVLAARLTYEKGSETFDAVYVPAFTPSRSPLLNQRWAVVPEQLRQLPVQVAATRIPGRGQAGVRWNHVGSGYEFSLSFFDGFNHLPLYQARPVDPLNPRVDLTRFFASMRMYGADAAVPLRWFTLKSEAAWFTSGTPQADEYAQYVVQLERQTGEWSFIGGYAGEAVTRKRSPLDFAPDRGLTRTFLGRAGYNLNSNSSIAFEGAVRQNGAGMFGRLEYSQAFGAHWRATGSFTLLAGQDDDFLGQYHRNSHFQFALRYSF